MTAQEKAIELFNKFYDTYTHSSSVSTRRMIAKKHAMLCAKEVRQAVPMYTGNLNPLWKFWNDTDIELSKL